MKLIPLVLAFTLVASLQVSAASQRIFVGTSGSKGKPSSGIYTTQLDLTTGELTAPVVAATTPNPGFLAISPDNRTLYAVGEGPAPDGKITGGVGAFAVNAENGQLTFLNARGTGGTSTNHLMVDSTGRMLMTPSYMGGYVAAFPVGKDGRLGERTSFVSQTGQVGPNTRRQDVPHPHSVTISPDNRFAYVCDLGLDKIFCYRLDPAAATLTAAGEVGAAPGAGPRHSKASADGRFLYVINELNNTVTPYARDAATGALTPGSSVSTVPEDFKGESTCAEIRIHPNGRFVYGSNRGHNSLAVFSRDLASGALTRVQIEPCGGGHPRNFALSSDGNWLVCANRDSNNLVVFKVDPATGKLTPTGHTATVPLAVCVQFSN